MQFARGAPPLGVVYNTTMNRADAALALAMLYGFESKRESRVGAVAVTGSGLGAAAFCDAVVRFYKVNSGPSNSNSILPVGLAADGALPADSPMVRAALDRHDEKGDPTYKLGIHKVTDTAETSALMRNALTGQTNGNAVMILSAPATYAARMLSLAGTRDLIAAKVRTLVICDLAPSNERQDIPAMRKLLEEWPTPIVLCSRDLGESLPFPAASIEKDFAWAPAHPIVDAYRAYRPMPYDAPSMDMAAALYAVHPDNGLFKLSDPGTLQVQDDGSLKLTPATSGRHRRLIADLSQKDKIVQTYIDYASAKPAARQAPFRPPQKKAGDPTVKIEPQVTKKDTRPVIKKDEPPVIKK